MPATSPIATNMSWRVKYEKAWPVSFSATPMEAEATITSPIISRAATEPSTQVSSTSRRGCPVERA